MRKVVFAINISLDGCCDHTKFNPGKKTMEFFTQLIQDADTFVYGRKTYELMVPYWPDVAKNHSRDKAENEFADAFDAVNKIVVFSKSLKSAEGEKTRIVRKNLKEEILKLKQEAGKNISTGGVDIASQLAELCLIDEFYFVVHPVVVGEGKRLFEVMNMPERLQLKLVGSQTFESGAVALHYLKQ